MMNERLYYPDYVDHGPHLVAWLIFAVLVALLALGVVYALARLGRPRVPMLAAASPRGAGDDALALLRLRYARGELAREDFLQASADLGGEPPPAATPPA